MDPLVAIMVALLGGGFVTAWLNLRRAPAERESLNLENLQKVNEGYQGLVAELRLELDRKEQEIAALRMQVAGLLERVSRLERDS